MRVAIIGSGPSGFYAAQALLRKDQSARIDLYDRLPTPFGLVRSGVAPDHPKLKQAILVYDRIARSDRLTYFGNIEIGKDISVADLRTAYHATIFACGAEKDRQLGIPGESLPGSHTATEFIGWYNGHPDYRDCEFDLSDDIAVVVGNGNVAADVTRILAKTADELRTTDIAEHALEVLAESRIREIRVYGRRGPAQSRFTSKELREIGDLKHCNVVVDKAELDLNDASEIELCNEATARNIHLLRRIAATADRTAKRKCHFEFLRCPKAMLGSTRVEQIVLEQTRLTGKPFGQVSVGTGVTYEQNCGIVFRSIGYRGIEIPGVPFNENLGVIQNEDGRVVCDSGKPIAGLYCTGWIKRGPSGVIGTNRADAAQTVDALLSDWNESHDFPRKIPNRVGHQKLCASKRVVAYPEWCKIDAAEVARGHPKGKPREKFTRIDEMLNLLERE